MTHLLVGVQYVFLFFYDIARPRCKGSGPCQTWALAVCCDVRYDGYDEPKAADCMHGMAPRVMSRCDVVCFALYHVCCTV